MRAIGLVLGLLLAACGPPARVANRNLASDDYRPGVRRGEVNARLERDGWCLQRQWAHADEWAGCHVSLLAGAQGEIFASFRYDGDRLRSIVVFVPVPCSVNRCDREVYYQHSRGRPWLDPRRGPVDELHSVGVWAFPTWRRVPRMTELTFQALAQELDERYGAAAFSDWSGTGRFWHHRRREGLEIVGLFVAPGGAWVVETHEFGVVLPELGDEDR